MRSRLWRRKFGRAGWWSRGTHGDIFAADPKDTLRVDLIYPCPSQERATDVDRVNQALQDKGTDVELGRMLSEMKVDNWSLAKDFHPLPGGGRSYRELRYWFQLDGGNTKGSHCLRGNHVHEGVTAIDERGVREVP